MRLARFWGIIVGLYALAALVSLALRPDYASLKSYRLPVLASNDGKSIGQVKIEIPSRVAGPQIIYSPAQSGELAVTLNNVPLTNSAVTRAMHISRNHGATVISIPQRTAARPEQLLITQSGDLAGLTPLTVYLGPAEQIDTVIAQQRFLVALVDLASRTLAIVATALLLVLLFFSRKTGRYFWMIVSTSILILVEYKHLFPFFGRPLPVIFSYLSLAFAMSAVMCVSVWSEGEKRERRVVAGIAALTATILIAADIRWGLDAAETITLRLSTVACWGIGALCFVGIRSLRFAKSDNILAVISFAMMCSFSAAMAIALVTLYAPVSVAIKFFTYGLTNAAEVLSMLSLLALAVIHELRQYQAERRRLGQMQSIIAGHHHVLDDQTARLQTEIEHRAILEERGRFTRDIHDGVGSRLLSLLIKARSGTLDAPVAEQEIVDAIADLRLVAAALDAADGTLSEALTGFCQRAEDQASNAGVAFHCELDASIHSAAIEPRTVLDAMRIMQEALSNALRHARATTVNFSARQTENGEIEIILRDDGCGIKADRMSAGRGLVNMRTRAQKLGAILNIASSSSSIGTKIELTIAASALNVAAAVS